MTLTSHTNPWRPLYEARGVALWGATAVIAWASAPWWGLYTPAFIWLGLLAVVMALAWTPGLIHGLNRRDWLAGRPLSFIDPEDFAGRMRQHTGRLWVGWGFDWEPRHAQEALDLIRVGPERFAPRDPERMGATWIHGIGGADRDMLVPLEHIEGHLLVVGTTGAGKTRLFDLLVTQAALRGEAVIIIDPKGDRGLRDSARRACSLAGQPERFVLFHPAFPDASVRLNPLANYQRPSELASRVAALIPSETGNDPFKAFGQMALSHIVSGLIGIDEQPTLVTLRRWLEGGPGALLGRVLRRWFDERVPLWRDHAEPYLSRVRDASGETRALLKFYRERVRDDHPSTMIDGLASMFEHEGVHFAKMIASLMPILVMLTSARLESLLSPNAGDAPDPRRITSLSDIIANREVLYVGLDSLSDTIVGGAIGSMLTADLAAAAGAIYNNTPEPAPANIFIDEAAEVLSDPMIQVMNKGRGAGLSMTLATQTFADFAARTGSQDKARQVLGNMNNLIALRVLDAETQEYVAEALPAVRLRKLILQQGTSTDGEQPLLFTGNVGERLDEEEAPLFPAALLGQLPNFEYLAKWAGGRVTKGRLPILGTPHRSRADRVTGPTPVPGDTLPGDEAVSVDPQPASPASGARA